MLQAEQVEELIHVIHALDRAALMEQLQSYPASFPVDFTREFLVAQTTDRLRHLFVALCLHTKRMPEIQSSQSFQ